MKENPEEAKKLVSVHGGRSLEELVKIDNLEYENTKSVASSIENEEHTEL